MPVRAHFSRIAKRLACLFCLMAAVAPSLSGLASEKPLSMGVFPRRNYAETTRLFTPMANYLGERLGRNVVLVTSRNFEAFSTAVTERRYDIVHYNQYHYIRSAQDYQVIAHIEELGRSTIAGALFVRKDSGITSPAQLRGRKVIFGGGEDAMMSYIAPRFLLLQAGLKKTDFTAVFAVNPPNAILALSLGQAAAAGAGDGALEWKEVRNLVDTGELTALAQTAPVLQLPVAVRRDMPVSLRTSIQAVLVDLVNSEEGRNILNAALMTGMNKAEDRDYAPHRKIAATVFDQDRGAARSPVRADETARSAR